MQPEWAKYNAIDMPLFVNCNAQDMGKCLTGLYIYILFGLVSRCLAAITMDLHNDLKPETAALALMACKARRSHGCLQCAKAASKISFWLC